MRFAPVLSAVKSSAYEEDGFKYIMAIASQAAGNDEVSMNYKKRMREIGYSSNNYLIVDNGVWETGQSMDDEALLHQALMMNASEIIVPDVMNNRIATLASIYSFLQTAMSKERYGSKSYKLMVVPQAKTADKWIEAYEEIIEEFGDAFHTIGIPKWLGKDRRRIINDMPKYAKYEYHMLGCNSYDDIRPDYVMNNPLRNVKASDSIWGTVRSIDSSLPYVLAHHKWDLIADQKNYNDPEFINKDNPLERPFDYFNLDFSSEWLERNLYPLTDNRIALLEHLK